MWLLDSSQEMSIPCVCHEPAELSSVTHFASLGLCFTIHKLRVLITISLPVFWALFSTLFNTQDHWQWQGFSPLSNHVTACLSFNVPAPMHGKQCGLFGDFREEGKEKTSEAVPRDYIWCCPVVLLILCPRCWSGSRDRRSFQPCLERKKATVNKHVWGIFLLMNLERSPYLLCQGRAAGEVRCVHTRYLMEILFWKLEDMFCTWCVTRYCVLWVRRAHVSSERWEAGTRGCVLKEWPWSEVAEMSHAIHEKNDFSVRTTMVYVHFCEHACQVQQEHPEEWEEMKCGVKTHHADLTGGAWTGQLM